MASPDTMNMLHLLSVLIIEKLLAAYKTQIQMAGRSVVVGRAASGTVQPRWALPPAAPPPQLAGGTAGGSVELSVTVIIIRSYRQSVSETVHYFQSASMTIVCEVMLKSVGETDVDIIVM